MKLSLSFEHTYEVVAPLAMPGLPTAREHYYPSHTECNKGQVLTIKVLPSRGEAWVGLFAEDSLAGRHFQEPEGVYSCPNPGFICIVWSGRGYLINTEDPDKFQSVGGEPITHLVEVVEKDIILLVDFLTITALGKSGVLWQTPRLAMDGITITRIDDDTVYGTATCLCTPDAPVYDFTVDLTSGAHTGGFPLA